jgi:heme-degrading monooxygenase HmoA
VIARVWRGSTTGHQAGAYVAHLRQNIFPELQALPGHRGAYLLQRASGDTVAFTVVTLWDSVESIRAFAGDDVEAAVVPAEARALLSSYDERAVHWDVPLATT